MCDCTCAPGGRNDGTVTVRIEPGEVVIPTKAIIDAINDWIRKGGRGIA
jgi:hypothetical protein